MILGLDAEVLEDGVGPEPLHVIPVLNLSMANRVVDTISWAQHQQRAASSPIKKSRSSVPRLAERLELAPLPLPRNEGLFATGGRAPELAALPAPAFVAIAVGNTNEGESLPAKPARVEGPCQPNP